MKSRIFAVSVLGSASVELRPRNNRSRSSGDLSCPPDGRSMRTRSVGIIAVCGPGPRPAEPQGSGQVQVETPEVPTAHTVLRASSRIVVAGGSRVQFPHTAFPDPWAMCHSGRVHDSQPALDYTAGECYLLTTAHALHKHCTANSPSTQHEDRAPSTARTTKSSQSNITTLCDIWIYPHIRPDRNASTPTGRQHAHPKPARPG